MIRSSNVKNGKKHMSSRQSMMLKMMTSYSIFLFIILLLFFYLYTAALKNARDQYRWQQRATLMSNVELFEKDLGIMEAYCRQLANSTAFKDLTRMDASDEDFLATGNTMSFTMGSDVYLGSLLPVTQVFCYLPRSGYVLDSECFVPKEDYYREARHYPDTSYELWTRALTQPLGAYRFLPAGVLLPDSSQDCFLYIVDVNDLSIVDMEAIVCFILEEDQLCTLFECMAADTAHRLVSVRFRQEEVLTLTTTESAFLNEQITGARIPKKDDLDALGISLDSYISNNTGFIYYFTYPSFETTSKIARPQILYPVFFVAVLVGGLVLIFMLSRRNIRPIYELGQQLIVTEQEKTSLLEEKSQLEKAMDDQRPMVFLSYVRQLLKGMIVSEQEASYAKETLGLTSKDFVYNGLYIVAYHNMDEDPAYTPPRTSNEYDAIVIETLRAHLTEHFYCFSPSDRTYALIVVGRREEEKDLIETTGRMVQRIHDALLEAYGIWIFAGIGKNTDNIVNVWESYQQAVEAANYTSSNCIFFPYSAIKKDPSAFYYPMELSTKLIHFITTGNAPQVMELFSLLHQENIDERSLPVNMLQFLLSDIRNTLLKARFALPQNTPKDTVKALDECFGQHVSFKLCEDIALRLCQLFTIRADDPDMISNIEKYIHKNYADPSMGLNKISDEFQISESYFSHIFKEKTGVNFSTYLENIRLSEAARLIRETDTGLNELYMSVGYNNANSFRRAFKKVYGITPSAMRDGRIE